MGQHHLLQTSPRGNTAASRDTAIRRPRKIIVNRREIAGYLIAPLRGKLFAARGACNDPHFRFSLAQPARRHHPPHGPPSPGRSHLSALSCRKAKTDGSGPSWFIIGGWLTVLRPSQADTRTERTFGNLPTPKQNIILLPYLQTYVPYVGSVVDVRFGTFGFDR
jgi:hypothetical protein